VRNIGISNFSPAQLDDLIAHSAVKPAVHQMELHPYLPQYSWLQHHHDLGIAVTAYSPLGNMNPTYGSNSSFLLDEQIVKDVAGKRNCTAAQVVLAWGVERGVSVIPKSKHEKYIRENLGAGECVLQAEDDKEMGKLGERAIRFNNPSKGWGIKLFEGLDNA
jgi:alcohol dehydrogenase (NADP+)